MQDLPSGINIFLQGFIATENLRFREIALSFPTSEQLNEEEVKRLAHYQYPAMKKRFSKFELSVELDSFTD